MGDRKDLHSPVRRAKIGLSIWIGMLPKDAKLDAEMALDKFCEVAEREIEQAYFDGNNQHRDSAQVNAYQRAIPEQGQ